MWQRLTSARSARLRRRSHSLTTGWRAPLENAEFRHSSTQDDEQSCLCGRCNRYPHPRCAKQCGTLCAECARKGANGSQEVRSRPSLHCDCTRLAIPFFREAGAGSPQLLQQCRNHWLHHAVHGEQMCRQAQSSLLPCFVSAEVPSERFTMPVTSRDGIHPHQSK